MLAGDLPLKQLRMVQVWIDLHREELLADWELAKEPLIYSSMSRVAGQIGKIATRVAQVVAGTTMPSRTRKRAPDLAATRTGRGLVGELLSCVSCQGAFSLMAALSKATACFFFPATSLFDRAGFNGWETPWHF